MILVWQLYPWPSNYSQVVVVELTNRRFIESMNTSIGNGRHFNLLRVNFNNWRIGRAKVKKELMIIIM